MVAEVDPGLGDGYGPPLSGEMQQLVDGLARRLSRTVAIDDRDVRLIAYSSHEGVTVDPLRQYSILNRRVPKDVAQYLVDRAGDGRQPFRVPPAPELGLELNRICVPVRDDHAVYGWLTLLEEEGPLEESDLALAVETARLATMAFRGRAATGDRTAQRLRELVPALLDGPAPERERAALELVESDLLVPAEPVVALVVSVGSPGSVHDRERTLLKVALDRVAHGLPSRRRVSHVRADHGVLLMVAGDVRIDGWDAESVGHSLLAAVDRELDAQAVVGIGHASDTLETINRSYGQARQAATVARMLSTPSRIAFYEELGIYALLAKIPPTELGPEDIPSPVTRLLDMGAPGRALLHTMETFLDRAGNAKVVAEELNVHRATLYYRLHRAEEEAGVDLADGQDRLVMHVGMKMARLAGLLPQDG